MGRLQLVRLAQEGQGLCLALFTHISNAEQEPCVEQGRVQLRCMPEAAPGAVEVAGGGLQAAEFQRIRRRLRCQPAGKLQVRQRCTRVRPEEHTCELQSLMRIAYAVFCLKKYTR